MDICSSLGQPRETGPGSWILLKKSMVYTYATCVCRITYAFVFCGVTWTLLCIYVATCPQSLTHERAGLSVHVVLMPDSWAGQPQ